MQIAGPDHQDITAEIDVLRRLLPFEGARVLELGCGSAQKTREIAENAAVREIIAAEIDERQHEQNLQIVDLPSVTFKPYGAQFIDEPNNSFDIVLMFKSLHHVPVEDMDTALSEIRRVLKPRGFAYISEPVFAGEFNEIMRLFHDESTVRQAAFEALTRAIEARLFELNEEYFFKNIVELKHFGQFEKRVINVTHTEHDLTAERLQDVKEKFESYRGENGYIFEVPNRVALLRKPSFG